jgi:hypothetical protein
MQRTGIQKSGCREMALARVQLEEAGWIGRWFGNDSCRPKKNLGKATTTAAAFPKQIS